MQIVILDGYSVNPGDLDWSPMKKLGTVSVYDRTPPSMVEQRLRGAEAVFVNRVSLTRDILFRARKLRFISELGSGYENIDLDASKERNITVCSIPPCGSDAAAQLTVAMLLEICQRTSHMNALVHNGRWSASPDFCYWDTAPVLVKEMTIGIVGIGNVGMRVAKIANALGMRVIGCSRTPKMDFCGEQKTFDDVIREADVLSLHCTASPATVGMINKKTLDFMKDGAVLINTARGSLINEMDVAQALKDGKLSACAVDAVSTEPISKNNPLLSAPNCIITPHYAYAPLPVRQKLIDIAAANLAAFLNETPINVVV